MAAASRKRVFAAKEIRRPVGAVFELTTNGNGDGQNATSNDDGDANGANKRLASRPTAAKAI